MTFSLGCLQSSYALLPPGSGSSASSYI